MNFKPVIYVFISFVFLNTVVTVISQTWAVVWLIFFLEFSALAAVYILTNGSIKGSAPCIRVPGRGASVQNPRFNSGPDKLAEITTTETVHLKHGDKIELLDGNFPDNIFWYDAVSDTFHDEKNVSVHMPSGTRIRIIKRAAVGE
jgi:hypothetical protein